MQNSILLISRTWKNMTELPYSCIREMEKVSIQFTRLIKYNQKHGMGKNAMMYKSRKLDLDRRISDEKTKAKNRHVVHVRQLKELRGEIQ